MKDDRMEIPKAAKAFLYIYIGGYPILQHFSTGLNIPIIFQVCILVIGSFFFSYGVVSFVLDIKKGGIRKIINRIKDFYRL